MKLKIDNYLVERSRELSKKIVEDVQEFINAHSTTSVERSVVRLFGVDGVNSENEPLPNILVDSVHKNGCLDRGIAYWLANACLQKDATPQKVAEMVDGGLDITKLPLASDDAILEKIDELSELGMSKMKKTREERQELLKELSDPPQPWLYLIVATGNIYEDIVQARASAQEGADIIAVIRSTAQSLLDYVPYGPTTEGFGGTYATQENFRLMREALDDVGRKVNKYIRLTNYASGLCMPEISVMGALERLDVMLNDSMYGILFRDINMKRTFVDQYFSRMINAYSGIIINTGEDNYMKTDNPKVQEYSVTASQFINEQFALKAGLPHEQMGIGHAFEQDPHEKNSFLDEMAHALLTRQLFPNSPIKYMPPTRFITGDIFQALTLENMFNLISITSKQGIHLLGILTEAIHTPFMHDRYIALESAKYIFNAAKDLGDELELKEDGYINKRANLVLKKTVELLEKIIEVGGLMNAISQGWFAGIKRDLNGGKGLDGVIKKSENYYNPFLDKIKDELNLD
jgi:beta-lysine 5,6-aminomutase alpha subunit